MQVLNGRAAGCGSVGKEACITHDQIAEDCECRKPVTDDALSKALKDFDEMLCAHGHEMHPSLHVLADYARGSHRHVIPDELRGVKMRQWFRKLINRIFYRKYFGYGTLKKEQTWQTGDQWNIKGKSK